MRHILMAAITLCFMMVSNAFAHDTWVEKKDGQFVVVYGHADVGKIETYDTSKIKEVRVYGVDGNIVQVVLEKEGYPAIIKPKSGAAIITLYFDNGFWSKTPDGWKNKPKKEQPDGVESSHSVKYSKALLKWHDRFSKPLGMNFEIVPLENPFVLKQGGKLPVKVFYDGKPLEGAVIKAGGYQGEEIKTGSDGTASVAIDKTGFIMIAASHKIPLKDNPDADVLSLSANITFEAK